MHGVGAHLKFDVDARGSHQGGVQRLVAVQLGNRDMVLEAPGHRLVQLMQHTQRGVAIDHAGDNQAHAVDVGDLRKAQVLVVHLLVDGVQGFFTAKNPHRHAGFAKGMFHFLLHPLHQVAPAVACAGDGFFQHLVTPGQKVAERQVLQLAVGLVQAQAVGNGRVNFQGFAGDAPPLGTRHVAHGAHVVGAVCQLDEDDTHIARHGQQHFAKRLSLAFLAGVELKLVQLGQAVHQLCHRGAKPVHQVRFGDAAVFHGVVQQGRNQGLGIQPPLGALGRYGNGVGDVGLAAAALLAQVGLVGITVGLAHQIDAFGAQIVQFGHQCRKAGRSGVHRSGAGRS